MRSPWKRVKLSANAPETVPSWPGASFSTRRIVASGSDSRQLRRSSEVNVRNEVDRYNLPDCKHQAKEMSAGCGSGTELTVCTAEMKPSPTTQLPSLT